MGGGVCWLDFNGDGWLDLHAVNSLLERRQKTAGRPGAACRAPRSTRTSTAGSLTSAPWLGRRSGACRATAASPATSTATGAPISSSRPPPASRLRGGRPRQVHRGRSAAAGVAASGWYRRRCDRRREWRRPPRPLRRRLQRPQRSPSRTPSQGFPTNLAGVRDLLYLNEGGGERPALPRGRGAGGARGGELHATASARLFLDLQSRRPARPLRRERRGSEPAVRERPVARRREGRPGRARLPARGAGRDGRASPTRTPAWASLQSPGYGGRPLRHQLAQRAVRRAYRPGRAAGRRSPMRVRPSTVRSGPTSPAGGVVRRPRKTPVNPTGGSPRARSRVRASCGERRTGPHSRPARERRSATATSPRIIGSSRPQPQRTRARGRRRRQRRPRGDRDQHDRRAPRPAAADRLRAGTGSTSRLSRFTPGDGRHRDAAGRVEARAGRARGWELPLVGGPARPLRARQGLPRPHARRALPVGGLDPAVGAERESRRHGDRARASGRRHGPRSRSIPGCTPLLHGQSVARAWNETAVAALRASGLSEPVQARDLFHLSAAMWDAWAAYDPSARGYFVSTKASASDVPVRTRRGDQLRRLPPPPLAGVVRREPRTHLRAARPQAAVALPVSRRHGDYGFGAGRDREPHRRRRDRLRGKGRLVRAVALRRSELHAAEQRSARRGAGRLRRSATRPSGSRSRSRRSPSTAPASSRRPCRRSPGRSGAAFAALGA